MNQTIDAAVSVGLNLSVSSQAKAQMPERLEGGGESKEREQSLNCPYKIKRFKF